MDRKTSFGMISPRLRGEWRHEFRDGSTQGLDYADVAGEAYFGIDGEGWSRDRFEISLGNRFDFPQSWMLDVELGLTGSSSDTSAGLQVQIGKAF